MSFSIITPSYQAAEYVRRCHWSLTRQTVEDWEWIIVDDASCDNTQEVVSGLGDARIRYHRLASNVGRGQARNYALERARREWVVILDMDDLCFPDRLEVAAAARAEGWDFVCSAMALIDDSYTVTGIRAVGGDGYPRVFPHATLCGDAHRVRRIGYPNFRRAQDQTMVLTLANTSRGHYHADPLYVYHENASVGLKEAYMGQYYTLRQIAALLRRRILRPTWQLRKRQVLGVCKLALLTPLFLRPGLYQHTLRLRKVAVAGDALCERRRSFLSECRERFPRRRRAQDGF